MLLRHLHYVAYIAAFTAFYAAAVACCQRDIKRGLAFSTISQIAYMLVALGVCFAVDNHHGGLGYMAGIFHLFTHAMFKALLLPLLWCHHRHHRQQLQGVHGRFAQVHAYYQHLLPHRLLGDCRYSSIRRFLVKG